MSSLYTLYVVPTAEHFEFVPDQEALLRTVEVLTHHGYLGRERPLGLLLTGPAKFTRDTVVRRNVDPSLLRGVLRDEMASTDQIRVDAEFKFPWSTSEQLDAIAEGERLGEDSLRPKDVERVAIVLTRLLAVFPGVEQLTCPQCGGRASEDANELWGPHHYEAFHLDVCLGLRRSCPSCSKETHPSDYMAYSAYESYPTPFFRFAISFLTHVCPIGGEPGFPADCLTDLSGALGVPLRVWHHHSV